MNRASMIGKLLTLALAGCVMPAAAQIVTFRVSDMDLRDPHMFVSIGVCLDVTTQFNTSLQDQLQTDSNGDGNLDLSYLLTFMPLDQDDATNFLAAGPSTCTAPVATTRCGAIDPPWIGVDAPLLSSGTCLTPVADTTRPSYTPQVGNTIAPCFVSPAQTFTVDLGGIPLTLREAQVAATFDGVPAQTLSGGLLRGFLTEADANAATIPPTYAVIGGRPLSSVLPGGAGNCAAHSDVDTLPDATRGWWFYFNFTAAEVVDPFANGFADGFEDPPAG